MSNLHRKLFARLYREAANGEGGGEGTAAPAGEAPAEGTDPVDWTEELNTGVAPGSDDEGEVDEPTEADPAPEAKPAKAPPEVDPTTGKSATPPEATTAATPIPEETPQTPEQIAAQETKMAADYAKWEEGEMARLSTQYAFDDETAARLQTEPELVLPQLAARLHIDVTRRALEAVQRMIPQMVPQVVQSSATEQAAAKMFYDKNPDLKSYHKQVLQAGEMYRKLNPKATPELAAEQIGNIVRTSLGLAALPATTAASTAAAPATKRTPHKPAGAGGSGVAAPGSKPAKNTWTDLLDDDD